MSTPQQPNRDLGNWLAAKMLEAVQDAITSADLAMPQTIMQVAGAGAPVVDVCDGLLWVRFANLTTTDGGTNQTPARWDFSIPGWLHHLEVGILFCHPVIDEGGNAPDPAVWEQMATRDGEYRSALLDGVAYRYPALVKCCADGQTIDPWTPIGLDDGYSGGFTVSHTIANFLRT